MARINAIALNNTKRGGFVILGSCAERVFPAGEGEGDAFAHKSGLINRHDHFQRFHSIISAASRLTILLDCFEPVLNDPAIGRSKPALAFGKVDTRIGRQTQPAVGSPRGFPLKPSAVSGRCLPTTRAHR